jgi:predicted HD superfamily hydrolase involved in NAD metabolism|tara:strand:+ start:197 stop:790 length:594 start_codon:yes stop_codon:yes gene_type:complete
MSTPDIVGTFSRHLRVSVPTGVFEHSERVANLAGELMLIRGEAPETAVLMGLAHDVCRHFSDDKWLRHAEELGLLVSELERRHPVLLHGPIGARLLKKSFNVQSKEVLHAVYYHTYGHPTFSNSAWAMFIADKIEPQKIQKNAQLSVFSDLSLDMSHSLSEIALAILDYQIDDLIADGREVHSLQVATRNFLVSERL